MHKNENIYREPSRLNQVHPSLIRETMNLTAKLIEQGHDVVSFSVGEPNFNTPTGIKEATIEALNANLTHYSSNRGVLELRRSVSEKIERKTGLVYDSETEVLITSSGSEAINNALLGTLEEGDEVILISPSFVSYERLIHLCKAIPVPLNLKEETAFQVREEDLKSKVTSKTKMIVMNNPCNPTGILFSEEALQAVANVAIAYNLIVFSDEIYSDLTYDDETFISIAQLPGMKERTIMMNGFSKTYAMTGWRVGYVAAHPDFIDHILRVHQYSTTTGVTFIQHGLAKSMNSEPVMQEVSQMVKQFDERRQRIMYEIDQIPGLSYVRPNGAFYIFVNVSGTGLTGDAFSRELLMTHDVATVPASAFGKGYDDYVRMSYATTKENIIKGFERIRRFVQRLNEEKRD